MASAGALISLTSPLFIKLCGVSLCTKDGDFLLATQHLKIKSEHADNSFHHFLLLPAILVVWLCVCVCVFVCCFVGFFFPPAIPSFPSLVLLLLSLYFLYTLLLLHPLFFFLAMLCCIFASISLLLPSLFLHFVHN